MWRCPTSWHPSEEGEEERLLPVLCGVVVVRPWELPGTRGRLYQAPLPPVRGLPCAPHQEHMLLSEGSGGVHIFGMLCSSTTAVLASVDVWTCGCLRAWVHVLCTSFPQCLQVCGCTFACVGTVCLHALVHWEPLFLHHADSTRYLSPIT